MSTLGCENSHLEAVWRKPMTIGNQFFFGYKKYQSIIYFIHKHYIKIIKSEKAAFPCLCPALLQTWLSIHLAAETRQYTPWRLVFRNLGLRRPLLGPIRSLFSIKSKRKQVFDKEMYSWWCRRFAHTSITASSFLNTAPARGLCPLSLTRFGSAPCSIRSLTSSACP